MATLGQYGNSLETMTAQEVFEAVVNHALDQGAKSTDNMVLDKCMYKGDGVCCFAAIFIKEYHPSLESNSWIHLVKFKKVSANHSSLIIELQLIHDTYETRRWPERFADLAERRNLRIPDRLEGLL